MERKSEWFCGAKFICSKFEVERENGCWTIIRFLAIGFLFTCGNFTLIFTVFFFQFFRSDFFLSGFPNPTKVHPRPSFLFEPNFFFSLMVFVHMQKFDIDYLFFFNSRTAIAGAIIGLLLVFFYFVVMIFVTTIWRHSHFLFIRSCNHNWIACVTSFFALSGASFFVHARD